MDFTVLTIDLLDKLAGFVGGYGWAIVALTVAIRLILWPLNDSQQRSMRKMQSLSPKMKELQTRYQKDPQVMQQKMMEFYKDNKFNPFAGCLPLLIQLPIFILLYGALMSPQFIQTAGDSSFYFIKRLDNTLKSYTGVAGDGTFSVMKHDTFSMPKKIEVTMNNGEKVEVKVDNPQKAIQIQGEIVPAKPIDFKISLDNINLKFEQLNQIKSAEVSVINNGTKEVETINFERKDSLLTASVPTTEAKTAFHYDILALVILFGLTMWFASKVMAAAAHTADADPTQQAMQKTMGTMMPIMITAMFFFFPIPAGVLLYLVVSNIIQIIQTVVINKRIDLEEAKTSQKIDPYTVNNAKKITDNKADDVN
ncbi:MAG: YidC/Oxa1 family membrane protein insertase [Candidatus Gastranaerophilales bacterium]|nr:YidC/Oxa1 family membrane protein insertase [Candidatus Gastranaerophilales bacterium]